jgi:hypothetical protein
VKSDHYSRQTRRSRLCIKVRRPRPGPSVTPRKRAALLVAKGGDLAGDAARAAERLELPAEITELLSPAGIPSGETVRARQRVWSDVHRLLIPGVRQR